MDPRRVTEELSVSPQIVSADVADLAAEGIRSIICNRPDGEGPNQPAFEEIEAAAKKHGLEVRYQPVESGHVRDDDISAFGALLDNLPKPVLAYCRSGTRSAMLWALSEGAKRPLSDILERTKAAGYDFSGLFQRIAGS